MSNPRVLLLGPPGAGKGTQSKRIVERFDVEHVTTGDALRENKDMETEYGTPREYMDRGELVPDPVVNEIVEAAIEDADGFVLDGYPRNESQTEYLDSITNLDVVIYLDVSEEELISRLTGRRVCSECGRNYHVEYDPPETEGVCDVCGGELYQRDDDTKSVARDRIEVYEENTRPVVEYFREAGSLTEIDGDRDPESVWTDVEAAIAERTDRTDETDS
ncbi:MAG: adenylate kinase [Halodesulfurarchaeum sp.]